MRPLTIRAKLEVTNHSYLSTLQDQADFEYELRMQLAQELMPELLKIMQIQKVPNMMNATTDYYGEVIAMKHDDYLANYAPHDHRRRGISDGTMAIMQNGNWMVVSNQPYTPPKIVPPKPPTPSPKKALDPSEYLKQRVSELQNGMST